MDVKQQNQQQNSNNELVIKQLAIMGDKNKLKKLKEKLIDKCLNCEDDDKMAKYLDMISKIDNMLKCHNGEEVMINPINEYARNNKEEFEILRGSILGNLEYEDWMLVRKSFIVKVIDKLLNKEG